MKDTLAFQIVALYRNFLAYTTKELRALGLNFGQLPILLYTGKHPGCTQADLTRALALDWGYSQRSVAKLADTGFLTKEYDPSSGCNCLRLTAAGTHAFDVSHQLFGAWDKEKTGALTREEQDTVRALLGKMIS